MGPRRTTIAYSSETAVGEVAEVKVHVYYCKYTGKHVLSTQCNLRTAPRRETDRSIVVDTAKFATRVYNSAAADPVFIKRRCAGGQAATSVSIASRAGLETERAGAPVARAARGRPPRSA